MSEEQAETSESSETLEPLGAAEPPAGADELLTGAEALTAMLRAYGVRLVFAYPGTSELALCATLNTHDDIRLINSRGDGEAALMAAGANLLAPSSAVSVLHGARGLTAALGAICDTRRSETPALHIIGMASRPSAHFLPPHAEHDLIHNAGAFATAAFDTSTLTGWDAAEFVDTVRRALAALEDLPGGPVLLGIPQDILEQPFISPALVKQSPPPAPPPAVEGDLDRAAQLLATAQRPVVFVDDYLLRHGFDTETQLGTLAATIAAPVLQVAYRRGPMLFGHLHPSRVPTLIGPYQPENPQHQAIMVSADLLVTIEDRNMYPRVVGDLPPCRKIAITSNPTATRKNRYLDPDDLLLTGHVPTILNRLAVLLERRSHVSPAANTNGLPRAADQQEAFPRARKELPHESRCPSATALATTIITALGKLPNPVLIDDSQMLGGLLAQHHHLFPPTLRIFGSHGGYVGSGLSTAVGAALATPDATIVCTVGDHGYTNGIKALAATGETKAPLLIIVCNNGGSTSLHIEAHNITHLEKDYDWLANSNNASLMRLAAAYGITSETILWPSCEAERQVIGTAARRLQIKLTSAYVRQPTSIEITTSAKHGFWMGIWHIRNAGTTSSASPENL